jgi:hypothetical protein
MKPPLLLAIALLGSLPTLAAEAPKKKDDTSSLGTPVKLTPLTAEQQKKLLESRIHGGMMGSFNSFASLLYAVHSVVTHTDDKEIAETSLQGVFPDFYKPTHAELFNSMARQMSASWSYDDKRAYWVFAKPVLPWPFKITLAPGWHREERGNYLFCKPPKAPVGMDVYVMGEYSSTPEDPGLAAKMREGTAMMFAKNFKKDVTAKDMSLVKVGNCEALHFKTPAPKPGITWRQWSIAENGQVVLIVSAMDDVNEKEILPGVEEALKSFEMSR